MNAAREAWFEGQLDLDPTRIVFIDETAANTQLSRLSATKRARDASRHRQAIDALRRAAETSANVMPAILDAVRAYATVGEMCDALREVWGEYEEVPII